MINAGAPRSCRPSGEQRDEGGAHPTGGGEDRDREATRDRVTARYLWDTAREIIEARCAAISRRPESSNKSWKYGEGMASIARTSPLVRERDREATRAGSLRTGFRLIWRLTLINRGPERPGNERAAPTVIPRESASACLRNISDDWVDSKIGDGTDANIIGA